MIKKKIGTITLAIGLITAGAVLFAQNFTDLPIKDIYKYWPLLLVGLGLEIIIYMSVYGTNNDNVRLSIDGLCIVFIILAAVFGSGNLARFGHINIQGIGDIPIIGGMHYGAQLEETVERTGISKNYDIKELKLTNSFGDIEIRKGNSKEIKLKAKVRVQYNDEAKARSYVKNAIKIEEGEITNIYIYIEGLSNIKSNDYNKAMVDFIVYIPEGITVDIKNSFGNIDIEGAGKINVKDSNGYIKLINCSKDAEVKNSFGKIEMSSMGGNINASNSNGDIDIEDVAGNVDAHTSFGNINLENIKGNIDVETSNGNVEIFKAKGNIQGKTSFGNVRLDEESIENGKVCAETSFGNISGFKDVSVKDSGAKESIEVTYGNGSKDISLKTSNGNIEVR